MYYEYFGFRQPPFRITPDTNLFYPGGERGAVLDALLYAILNGEGIVKVVGEVGSGKTMLCRMLEQELPDKVEVVYLANPSLSPENTLYAIAFELGLDMSREATRFEVMNRLQEYLLQRHSQDRQVVVFVEEAQAMPLATLEEIRLLSNLETQHNKLLQIVLFGQPELDEMIATPEIRQLKERITYSFRLNPFENQDIRDYLNSRIRACGYRADALFDRAAVSEIEGYSRGLLRRINILADKALLAAYAENTHRVTSKHIRKAASDSEFASDAGRRRWRRPALVLAGGVALVLLVILAAWLAGFGPSPVWRQGGVAAGQPPVSQDEFVGEAAATAQVRKQTPAGAPDAAPVAESAQDEPLSDLATEQETVEKTDSNVKREAAVVNVSPDAAKDTEKPAADEAAPEEQAKPTANSDAGNANPAGRLYTVIELSGLDDVGFSRQETDALRRQLDTVPPESVVLSGPDPDQEICDRCRSLVYRPVKSVENL